jgi:hypothetical protein
MSDDDDDDDDVPEGAAGADGTSAIEEEDTGDPSDLRSKYDPSLIRVDPRTFSLHQVLDMIDAGEMDLTPDFQRNKVWKPWQKSRLIESIFLRIPLPAFYFAADGDGLIHVVDGLQRLSTVYDFVNGARGFSTLSGLQYLTAEQLGGLTWDTVGGSWKRRLHTTQIFAQVIDPQTPLPVKLEIFQRLNQGGAPLTAHEIRNSISRKRSRDFLRELANSPAFLQATGSVFADHPRMADFEAVLRVCAFRIEVDLGRYEDFGGLDDFLTAAARRLDNEKKFPAARLEQLRTEFERAMHNALGIFGKHAFRKQRRVAGYLFPINKALLESWGCVLADYQWKQLEPKAAAIGAAFRTRLLRRDEYWQAITSNTTSVSNVRLRFRVARDILKECL